MNKFRLHCGKPIKPTDRSCSHCGKSVIPSKSGKQSMSKRSEIHSNKLKSQERNIIIGAIIAIFVLIFGSWGSYQHGRNSVESTVIGGNGRLTDAKIKKILRK